MVPAVGLLYDGEREIRWLSCCRVCVLKTVTKKRMDFRKKRHYYSLFFSINFYLLGSWPVRV